MSEPRHLVLATAGHIDHGKTELTRALTGIDTDRLKEEKERGITIDLGFAHTDLGQGRSLSVIDVPGHERFVKNMLAGVGGVDLALLVIAADESVMPQTREHLDILKLLGVRRGVVALTKSDLVDAETLELARLETAEFVAGSFLDGAPILAVSARTGAGITELRAALESAFDALESRSDAGPFRLHLDRAFSIKGFGSVVTGTVVSGRVEETDEVEILPEGLTAKVRGVEVHGQAARYARAGSRAALNLAGVDLERLRRGQQVVAPVGAYRPTSVVDVRLRWLAGAPKLKDLTRVRLHLGAEEILARIKLIGTGGELEPGGTALAQLRAERRLVAWPGDRFIIRRYSPATTVGGGEVVDGAPRKHRGSEPDLVARLEAMSQADLPARIALIARSEPQGIDLPSLVSRLGRPLAAVAAALEAIRQRGGVVVVAGPPPTAVDPAVWETLERQALEAIRSFHDKEPLREGLSREELRERLRAVVRDANVIRAALDDLAHRGKVKLLGEVVALASHRVSLGGDEAKLVADIEGLYRAQGLNPPSRKEVAEKWPARAAQVDKLIHLLVRQGKLATITAGVEFHVEALARVRQLLAPYAASGQGLSVAHFKDLTGTTRKHAIPLLEYLDREHLTRRVGDLRFVIKVERPPG